MAWELGATKKPLSAFRQISGCSVTSHKKKKHKTAVGVRLKIVGFPHEYKFGFMLKRLGDNDRKIRHGV